MANSGSTSAIGTAVEREVPRRVPGVLPLVGHRDDVGVVEMVQSLLRPSAGGGRRRLAGVAVQPVADDVVVELLRPEQPAEGLPQDVRGVFRERAGDHGRVKLVGFSLARIDDTGRVVDRARAKVLVRQTERARLRAPARHRQAYRAAALVPVLAGLTAPRFAVHDVRVEAVFDERRSVRRAFENARDSSRFR